jgi:general secretion pathway protein H
LGSRGPGASPGFTLIEVTAAMLIVALVATLALPRLPGTGRASLKAVALEAASLLRRERLGAILTGRSRDVMLDGVERALVGTGGGLVAIPRDVRTEVLGAAAGGGARIPVATFHPDGGSSGGVLRLSREGAGYEVRVNWYLGTVSVEDPAP